MEIKVGDLDGLVAFHLMDGDVIIGKLEALESENNSFIWNDVNSYRDKISPNVKIVELIAIKSEKGTGRYLIEAATDYFSEAIIIAKAEPYYYTQESFDLSLTDGSFEIKLEELMQFYLKNGFVDINNIVGYQFGKAIMYLNKPAKKIKRQMDIDIKRSMRKGNRK